MADSTSTKPSEDIPTTKEIVKRTKEVLLCIFIHGFKGTDSTFGDFPRRLQHILDESISHIKTECIVFPAYETKGELNHATDRFVDWLTTLTVEHEVAQGLGGGAGKAQIVLCSHSMGGLLAADACLAIANSRPDSGAPLWPRIIACIAFDTPYFGLHPWVFKNQASKALDYIEAAKNVASGLSVLGALGGSLGFGAQKRSQSEPPRDTVADTATSSAIPKNESKTAADGSKTDPNTKAWTRFLTPTTGYTAGGILLASAAAGTAYYNRQQIGDSVNWAQDHLKYVGTLWDEKKLAGRVSSMIKLSKDKAGGGEGIIFRNFYTCLPPKKPRFPTPRTFIILPPPNPQSSSNPGEYFLAATNGIADDEITAHTGMFEPVTNDGYFELGLGVVEVIRNALGELPLSDSAADSIVDAGVKMEEESHQESHQAAEETQVEQPST
ncbi:hypothetical protein FRC02_006276 [Tulasnella sp. 418]|nr:hypothetical protein FRC02_006276 [Tulasnella sp. 418]